MEVVLGGGFDWLEIDLVVEGVLFVVEGEGSVIVFGWMYVFWFGSYVYFLFKIDWIF